MLRSTCCVSYISVQWLGERSAAQVDCCSFKGAAHSISNTEGWQCIRFPIDVATKRTSLFPTEYKVLILRSCNPLSIHYTYCAIGPTVVTMWLFRSRSLPNLIIDVTGESPWPFLAVS
jgi:hypothetical protein